MKKEDYLGIENYKVVGTRPIRHDGTDKVTGRAVYGPDFHLTGSLYGDQNICEGATACPRIRNRHPARLAKCTGPWESRSRTPQLSARPDRSARSLTRLDHRRHRHAWIKSIDTSKAEALPGVKAIVLGKDLVQNYEDKVSDNLSHTFQLWQPEINEP